MSFMDTFGTLGRFRTRAQNWAMSIESAPRSSKKWLSTSTCSTFRMPLNTSVNVFSMAVGGAA
jgi:hypothetical protein